MGLFFRYDLHCPKAQTGLRASRASQAFPVCSSAHELARPDKLKPWKTLRKRAGQTLHDDLERQRQAQPDLALVTFSSALGPFEAQPYSVTGVKPATNLLSHSGASTHPRGVPIASRSLFQTTAEKSGLVP